MRFQDQIVIVTGAARGIGYAAAELIAREGGTVVVNDLEQSSVEHAVERIRSVGGKAEGLVLDARDTEGIDVAVRALVDRHGVIDVLVNNAGVMVRRPAEELTLEDWRRGMSINLDGAWCWAQAVARHSMIPRRKGVIVNVASLAGLVAIPNAAPYVASKHGLVGLTKALALDWGRYNIRINALCPGMTWTDLSKADRERNPAYFIEREKRIPLGRASDPAEQAAVIAFLACSQSSSVHGAVINVDGGNLAMHSGASLNP